MQVDGFSLDAQKEKLKKYADFQDMVVVREFSDEGKSGKNVDGRPQFKEMLCLNWDAVLRKNPHGDGYETRIAKANNMSEEKVRAIIEKCTDSRFLGALEEKTVIVLKVNLLDGIL